MTVSSPDDDEEDRIMDTVRSSTVADVNESVSISVLLFPGTNSFASVRKEEEEEVPDRVDEERDVVA